MRGFYFRSWPTGNRSGSVIPRALFDSDFVQQRYTFSSVLRTSPAGVTGIDATEVMWAFFKAHPRRA